jgi:fibronectin-binding protein A (FbpA)/ribosomal quality control pathway NFACT family protein
MEARFLEQFCAESAPRLAGASVRRFVPVADGLILELETRPGGVELGLLGPTGAAWAYCIGGGSRAALHAELGDIVPELAAPLAPALRWPTPAATGLDALRAWLLRPEGSSAAWGRLERARLVGMRARPNDRRLWLEFETSDAVGRTGKVVLVAELFDRAANFILVGGEEPPEELANWRRRRPAPESKAALTPANAVVPVWDAAARRVRADTPRPGALGLLAAAHADFAWASAAALARAEDHTRKRRVRRLRALLDELEADAERARMASTWRHQGELLVANLHRVKRGEARIRLADFDANAAAVTIELDPALSPQENAAELFRRARRGERGRERIEARLQATRSELESLGAGVFDSGSDPDVAPALSWPQALAVATETWRSALPPDLAEVNADALWAPGGPRGLGAPSGGGLQRGGKRMPGARGSGAGKGSAAGKGPAGAADRDPGRRFVVSGEWEVRVGRNNRENDELTHGFAHPDDVWLHASGVPGSHVVLRMQGRRDNPPRDILEAAAAIAARFSQAKHAGTVPVIWTRKRHVRKPRGSKPGVATCTHEKTLFVKPGLPDSGGELER